MDSLSNASENARSAGDRHQELLTPKGTRYGQLPRIDQAHAESLTRSCHLTEEAKRVSRILEGRSLLQSILTSLPLVIADFVTLWALLLTVTAVLERSCDLPPDLVTRSTALVVSMLLVPIARLAGLYPALGTSAVVEFRQIVQSAATALCIFAGIGIVANPAKWPYFAASTLLTMLLAVPILPAVRYVTRGLAAKASWWGAPVLIYAKVEFAAELFRRLHFLRQRGLRPVGVLLSGQDYWYEAAKLEEQGIPAFDVRDSLNCAMKHKATWLLIGTGSNGTEVDSDPDVGVYAELNAIPNRVLLTSDGFDCGMWDRTHTIGPVSGLWLSNPRNSSSQARLKRFLDVVMTLMIGIVFSPIILAIALAIRFSSKGPILYSQQRVGRGGRPFAAWKFRSMLPDADRVLSDCLQANPALRTEWEETHKLKSDPRVTWIGRLIRATSFDELPQLWNILRGDMSLVGPRPIVDSPMYDAKYIQDYPDEFTAYCSVRPGLTGLWQVTCRNNGVYEMRIYWDMYYIRNWSFWLDLYITLRTIRTVLLREGAS